MTVSSVFNAGKPLVFKIGCPSECYGGWRTLPVIGTPCGMDPMGATGCCLTSPPKNLSFFQEVHPQVPWAARVSGTGPEAPNSIVSIWHYESRNFLEPSFSPVPSQAENPTLSNSGLWAAPGTLLALPGGPVKKRLIFLPPVVQKILPAAPDRFGAWLGGREGSDLQPHPTWCRSPLYRPQLLLTHIPGQGAHYLTGNPLEPW